MKKRMSIVLVGILLLSGFGAVANSKNICEGISDLKNLKTLVTPLALPDITDCQIIDSDNGQKIYVEGFGRLSTPGEPNLPSKIFSIAIPPGAQFVNLYYENSEEIIIPGNHIIRPITPPQLTGKDISSTLDIYNQIFEDNYNSIYNCDTSYPEDIVEFVRTSGYRKYNIVDVRVTPFTYNPLSGQLKYHPEITVFIEYNNPQENLNIMSDDSFKTEKIAREIIVNYEQAKQWYPSNNCSSQGLYDFVIITLDSLTSAVTPLVDWETEKGRTVKVVTTSWIDLNYEGYDLAEKMRNFLREKYPTEEWGIEDVLIVGHWDDVPMRKTSQKLFIPDGENAETDFYYAELSLPDNESWDADEDHKYGEILDSIDFFSEINVGRIPWSDFETVQHICEKSVAYEQNNDTSFKNNILLLANFINQNTDGATFMEYCVNEELHPWMSSWMKTRMYERDSTYNYDYISNHHNVLNVWSEGTYGIVSWHAHGNPFGSGNFISIDDCQYLNDEYPAIISAASCSNSDTDYLNIGQAMMKQGAVGFLGANKVIPYQTEWDDVNDGSDQSFKYFFISSITSGKFTQGQAHQYALREMYQRGLWDRLKYETFVHGSLFGNPNLGISSPFKNNQPMKPIKPDGPISGRTRREQSYSTISTDPDNDDIYYCFSWGDGNIEWVGPYSSGQEINVSHRWVEQGNYEIKVKAKDIRNGESEWSDPLTVSMPRSRSIDNFNPWLLRLIQRFPILEYLL